MIIIKHNTPKVRFHRKKSETKRYSSRVPNLEKKPQKYCRRSYILGHMTVGINESLRKPYEGSFEEPRKE